MLKLRAPLRREEWFHNGFVALEAGDWPDLLERWWELNELVPAGAGVPRQPAV